MIKTAEFFPPEFLTVAEGYNICTGKNATKWTSVHVLLISAGHGH